MSDFNALFLLKLPTEYNVVSINLDFMFLLAIFHVTEEQCKKEA